MRLNNKVIHNSISDALFSVALREMRAHQQDEYDEVHDGSGRSEELPSDLKRRHDKELLVLRQDRDLMSIVEWKRMYGWCYGSSIECGGPINVG